jgi:hypothetical protein
MQQVVLGREGLDKVMDIKNKKLVKKKDILAGRYVSVPFDISNLCDFSL